jgi:uncharacterized protein
MEPSTDMPHPAVESLQNYYGLVAKVDEMCRRIEGEFAEHLSCRKGCSGCCRHISLFWVEAVALALALDRQPEAKGEEIRQRAQTSQTDGPCPLLEGGACLLYENRPIICRTHGLPVLMGEGDDRRIDFCDLNFSGLSSLPAHVVLDLNLLNATLAAIDNLFVSEVFHGEPPEQDRLTIAEALQLDL